MICVNVSFRYIVQFKCFFYHWTNIILQIFQGEYGFFRIAMYEDNLGIENDCVWATPKL